MPLRLTRDEKKARTRADLVAAARRVFGRRGFHDASLEEIAAAAGLSTGAVYSNFSGKEDLFLAVFEDHVDRRIDSTRRALEVGGSPDQRARAAADEWMRFLRTDRDWFPLFIEFWRWALRDPGLRRRFALRYRRFREANADFVRALGVELPAAEAGIVVTALADGLALMKLADPRAVPDELFGDALALLLRR